MNEKKQSAVQPLDDFRVSKPANPISNFDTDFKNKQDADEKEAWLKANTIDDDQPDYEKEDEYGQSRLHCWVLMQKGNRELQETFFIEPTTGRKYSLDESPYYSVEAIFNNKNTWINLDPTRGIDELDFDF